MKSYFLNAIYALLLLIAIPWLIWRAVRLKKNRRGWLQKLFGYIPARADRNSNQHCIWFHAVSVGEVNLLATMLDRLEAQLPGWHFAISTTTETGYGLACKKYPHHQVFFCPIDFSWSIQNVLNRLNPAVVVLAELELWPNLIRIGHQRQVQLAIVNGRLSEKSFTNYRYCKFLMRRLLSKFDLIAVQSGRYAARFLELGADSETVIITGNVKFDGVRNDRGNQQTQALSKLAGIEAEDTVFVAGSTQPEEDRIAIDVWQRAVQQCPRLRLVLVPRHPQNVGLTEAYLKELGIDYSLRSGLDQPRSQEGKSDRSILIVDTVGELNGWWGTADVAYVGGSMGKRGGQNMIEPAAYGVPVSFGPNTKNFRDITEMLLAEDAAIVVQDGKELGSFVQKVLNDRPWAALLGERARRIVTTQQGAADETVRLLVDQLPELDRQGSLSKVA